MERLSHLDGLRGLAALIVVISHYIAFFCPVTLTFLFFSSTPIYLLYAGNFAVCVFFSLSGFVLSINYINTQRQVYVGSLILKRYVRLAIPVIASVLFSCFLLKNSLFTNLQLGSLISSKGLLDYYNFEPLWRDALINGFIGAFLPGSSEYNPVLWTMSIEFVGSCLVFTLLAIFAIFSKINRSYIYLFLIFVFFNSYFLCFIIGMICSELYVIRAFNFKKLELLGIFVLSLYLGIYPGGLPIQLFMPLEALIHNIPVTTIGNDVFFHIIGSALLLVGVLSSKKIADLLRTKVCQLLGEISFSLYLIHVPILCSFSCFIYLICLNDGHYGETAAFFITGLLTLPVLLICSLFFLQIDNRAIRFSQKIQASIISFEQKIRLTFL